MVQVGRGFGQTNTQGAFFEIAAINESGNPPPDNGREKSYETSSAAPDFLPAHRWRLLTLLWDFRAPDAYLGGEFLVNSGLTPPERGSANAYNFGDSNNVWQDAMDITAVEAGGPHLMRLGYGVMHGPGMNTLHWPGTGADVTLDEFCIYDFGGYEPDGAGGLLPLPDVAAIQASPDLIALDRHKRGRYYKGSSYNGLEVPITGGEKAPSYFTAPITLPAGSRLWQLAWTWYRPTALPTDFAELELATVDGTGYLGDEVKSRSTQGPGWSLDRQDWNPALQGPVPGAFRIHVLFRRQTPVDGDTPILDSPILDDITLVYLNPQRPALLAWGPGD
jgi:hypothetical protein